VSTSHARAGSECYTAEEIGKDVGLERKQSDREVMDILENLPKSPKVTFSEEDFQPPIYNVWIRFF
jgi:hypothetical protein